jgi:YfiH family protein
VNFRFTDSTGGNSVGAFRSRNLALHVGDQPESVERNRLELSDEIDRPIQFMNQVHGNDVEVIDQLSHASPTADALVTTNPKIALAVMVADCMPLLLSNQGSVAAVHVGRRGLVNRVTQKTLSVMSAIDSSPITAIIGPSICCTCYEVSEDVFDEVTSLFPRSQSQTSTGGFALNLAAALSFDLQESGITVHDHSRCTVEESSLFSYRRDGVTGRQAGVIWL